jgi:putative membrane protein
MLRDLRQARRGSFDTAFNQAQLTAHQEALALHRGYAAGGDVPALRATAAKAVPVVEMHLRHVEQHRHH